MSTTEDTTTKKSHLRWVEQLPEDIIKIDEYRDHKFENLYYSPSTDEFYQAPKIKYRILAKDDKCFRCRSDKASVCRISLKKIMPSLTGAERSSMPTLVKDTSE